MNDTYVHPTAAIEDGAAVGPGSAVWSNTQIRRNARIGAGCNIGRNVFVDVDVIVGDRVKVQNNASLFEGVTVEDGVFIGPHVVFTNDKVPRAVTPAGRLKSPDDWELGRTVVRTGAAIGAAAVVVTGVSIGRWAMVGAGTVVTGDVPDHGLVLGNPGRLVGYVSAGGTRCTTAQEAESMTEAESTASTENHGGTQ